MEICILLSVHFKEITRRCDFAKQENRKKQVEIINVFNYKKLMFLKCENNVYKIEWNVIHIYNVNIIKLTLV